MRYFKYFAPFSRTCEKAVNNRRGVRFSKTRKAPQHKALKVMSEAQDQGAETHHSEPKLYAKSVVARALVERKN
jgi:hypothetical protein